MMQHLRVAKKWGNSNLLDVDILLYNNDNIFPKRLRDNPDYGTILELMYRGESVHVDKEMTWESGAAYYLKHDKTGTIGYADFHI